MIVRDPEQKSLQKRERAGTRALRLLAAPVSANLLTALGGQQLSLLDLRRATGFPPQTTIRGYLRSLDGTGILIRRRQNAFPGNLDIELSQSGRALLRVHEEISRWLSAAPTGPIEVGTPAAKAAVKTLIEAWATNMVRALAARPLSLTELDSLIGGLSYPSLERRLAAMRVAGQVQRAAGKRGASPYEVTSWLRQAMAPLVQAVRWELAHLETRMTALSPRDVEALFLLALPLVKLPTDLAGTCRLTVELRTGGDRKFAGVRLTLGGGQFASCSSRLEGKADSMALGTSTAWLNALGDGNFEQLEFGGDQALASSLTEGLHQALFADVASVSLV